MSSCASRPICWRFVPTKRMWMLRSSTWPIRLQRKFCASRPRPPVGNRRPTSSRKVRLRRRNSFPVIRLRRRSRLLCPSALQPRRLPCHRRRVESRRRLRFGQPRRCRRDPRRRPRTRGILCLPKRRPRYRPCLVIRDPYLPRPCPGIQRRYRHRLHLATRRRYRARFAGQVRFR